MAGAEIEDIAGTTTPGETRTENLTALEPGNEDGLERLRYGKLLAIHLLVFQLEMLGQAGGDRVAGIDGPQAFAFARLAPLQCARRTHQALERLGEVAGMQDDEAHAFPDALGDALHNVILNCAVVLVAPPDENVGLVEALL